jgi:hypothetical protein
LIFLPLVESTTGGFPVAASLFTVALALVHLVGRWVEFEDVERRRQWLSAAGGATVAYVFVLLLPEVSEAAVEVGQLRGRTLLAEQTVFLAALLGFVGFYGVEVLVVRRRHQDIESSATVFWGHVTVFACYSILIGYLLFHQEVPGVANLFFYALAMALHFEVTDYGLRQHHGVEFDRVGRWLLAGATLTGGLVGALFEIDGLLLSIVFGFLAGAIVLNVVKQELPEVNETRFAAFVVGAAAYSLVLLFT